MQVALAAPPGSELLFSPSPDPPLPRPARLTSWVTSSPLLSGDENIYLEDLFSF